MKRLSALIILVLFAFMLTAASGDYERVVNKINVTFTSDSLNDTTLGTGRSLTTDTAYIGKTKGYGNMRYRVALGKAQARNDGAYGVGLSCSTYVSLHAYRQSETWVLIDSATVVTATNTLTGYVSSMDSLYDYLAVIWSQNDTLTDTSLAGAVTMDFNCTLSWDVTLK